MTKSRRSGVHGRGRHVHGAAAAAQVVGCVGAVLSVGLNAPQAWRSCRRQRVAGLSPAARWTAVAHSATWLVYGLVEQVPLQVVTNLVCGLLHAAVLTALLVLAPAARRPGTLVPQALLTGAWLAVVLVCARTGAASVGTLAAAAGVVAAVPQLWHLLRHSGLDASGVCRTTTGLGLAASLCWALHGALLLQPAVALPSLFAAGTGAVTLVLLRRAGTPVPAPHPATTTSPDLATTAEPGLLPARRARRPSRPGTVRPWTCRPVRAAA